MAMRAEFTTLTKLKSLVRYIRCPGVFELGIKCGKQFGSLSEIEFDHVKRCEIEPDASPENCRPLCKDCHKAKTIRKDTLEAKKGRNLRGENKPKVKRNWPTGAKIQSRGFPSPEERRAVKEKYERVR
jgi:hypothetical protein